MRGSRGLGEAGERLACDFLLEKGYELLETNWRCSAGELDLVMRQAGTLVFVEVKTRRGDALGTPEEAVTPAKQARLGALALGWLAAHYGEGETPEWRIDVVGVHLSPSGKLSRINHVPDAVTF